MKYIEWLNTLYRIIYPCSTIIFFVQMIIMIREKIPKQTEEKEKPAKNTSKNIVLYNLVCTIVLLAIELYLIFQKKNTWLIIVTIIPPILNYCYSTFHSATMLGIIVRSSDEKRMSYKEKASMVMIATVLSFGELFSKKDYLLQAIIGIESKNTYDLLITIYYLWRIYALSFCNCFMLSIPAQLIVKIGRYLSTKTRKLWESIIFYLSSSEMVTTRGFQFAEKVLMFTKQKKLFLWKLLFCLLPLICLVDIAIGIIDMIRYMFCEALLYLLLVIQGVGKVLAKPIMWFGDTSDRKIVALSFRLAMISTLTTIVILNRINPIYKNYESSTAICEFVASVIIIPIVFEGINAIKKRKSQ